MLSTRPRSARFAGHSKFRPFRNHRTRSRSVAIAACLVLVGCKDDAATPPPTEEPSLDWLLGLGDTDAEVGSAGGSGADDPSADDWRFRGADGGPGDEAPPPEPFSRELEGFVANQARWAGFDVEVLGVRVERGMDDEWYVDDWGYAWEYGVPGVPGPDDAYVEVEVAISSRYTSEEELPPRSTWDILLADGTRLRQSNTLAVLLAPGDRTVVTLRHLCEPDVDLAGASLELNASERGYLQPERIPLDADYAPDIDVELTQLIGHVAESTRPEDYSRSRFEIRAARVSRNSRVAGRAETGAVFVDLDVSVTVLTETNGSYGDETFGIVANGALTRPVNSIWELFDGGTTHSIPVAFSIPDSTTAFDLRFEVGWDSDQTPETEWHEVHVELADGEPAGVGG